MDPIVDRSSLRAWLEQPQPHEILAAADAERARRHGRTTTVVALERVDATGSHTWCPLTGRPAPEGGFARDPAAVSDAVSDLLLLVEEAAPLEALESTLAGLGEPPGDEEFAPTVQVGTADDWIAALEGRESGARLRRARERGLGAISEGVAPRVHPSAGPAATERWRAFWTEVAAAGLRGHAVVLYGGPYDLEAVLAQIDAIAAVQDHCGVFLSVAPVIAPVGERPEATDALRTHALEDLRIWAACRLGLPGVDHVSLRYDRGDLKSTHAALRGGIDDLVGHLHLHRRDRRADADHPDLSLPEMERWLQESGMRALVRNARFETLPLERFIAETLGPGADAPREEHP